MANTLTKGFYIGHDPFDDSSRVAPVLVVVDMTANKRVAAFFADRSEASLNNVESWNYGVNHGYQELISDMNTPDFKAKWLETSKLIGVKFDCLNKR